MNLLDKIFSCVFGCVESLNVFRKVFPKMSNYKQENLAKSLLGDNYSYGAHDACEDVKALCDLIQKKEVKESILLSNSFPLKAVYKGFMFSREKSKNIKSLEILISSGVLKRPTIENVAGSGLKLQHLLTIYKRNGEDGLRSTLILLIKILMTNLE